MSPLLRSIARWFAICAVVFLLAMGSARMAGNAWEPSIWIAVAAAGPVALGALGFGGVDQWKFNQFSMPLNRPRTLKPW